MEEAGKKRHQSEQSKRVRREQVGVIQPFIGDDSHVSTVEGLQKERRCYQEERTGS